MDNKKEIRYYIFKKVLEDKDMYYYIVSDSVYNAILDVHLEFKDELVEDDLIMEYTWPEILPIAIGQRGAVISDLKKDADAEHVPIAEHYEQYLLSGGLFEPEWLEMAKTFTGMVMKFHRKEMKRYGGQTAYPITIDDIEKYGLNKGVY